MYDYNGQFEGGSTSLWGGELDPGRQGSESRKEEKFSIDEDNQVTLGEMETSSQLSREKKQGLKNVAILSGDRVVTAFCKTAEELGLEQVDDIKSELFTLSSTLFRDIVEKILCFR